MFRKSYKTQEVFGQSRGVPLNYVVRGNIDNAFKESLKFNQNIVLYGSSKQGKTSLRKQNIDEENYILVHCSNKWNIGQLNAQILKQAGFQLQISTSKTIEGNAKVSASLKIFHIFKSGAEGGVKSSRTDEFQPLELDIYDSNDIIDSLEVIEFDKYIVLEDFHYLKDETQKDFAFQLKSYNENSNFTFIIVGVWLEENKLTLLNGDLAGRVYSINADLWNKDQLCEVIEKGEKLLNVVFSDSLKNDILKFCIGSVFILQEICKMICLKKMIFETQNKKILIEKDFDVFELTKKIIIQQNGRYNTFLRAFKMGFGETELEIYKWMLYPVLNASTSQLLKGLSFNELKGQIQNRHPLKDKLDSHNLLNALNSISLLQMSKNIKPNIIDYDQTNMVLNIVDRGFISWLVFQDRSNLLKIVGLPVD